MLGSPLTPISISGGGGGGGMDQSVRSESSSSGPPTLSSLSATNSTATTPTGPRTGQTPRSRVAPSLLRDVAAAALDVAASASSSRGGGSASPSPSLRAADVIFGYGGYSAAAATTPSEKAIGGCGNPPAAKTTTAEGKRVFVQPIPASLRIDSAEKRSSHGVDVSGGGKRWVYPHLFSDVSGRNGSEPWRCIDAVTWCGYCLKLVWSCSSVLIGSLFVCARAHRMKRSVDPFPFLGTPPKWYLHFFSFFDIPCVSRAATFVPRAIKTSRTCSSVSYFSHRRGPSSTSCGVIEELDNGDLHVALLDKTDERWDTLSWAS